VRGCVEQLQPIDREIDQLNTSQKSLSAFRDHFDERRFAQTELQLKQERLLKQLSNAEDKLERAQKHAEDKKAAGMRTIERLRQEYEDISLERQQNDQELKAINDKADGIVVMVGTSFVLCLLNTQRTFL
jgi:kinetochore protein Nuf2